MISKQIPFDAKLAMKAWKESSNAKVYYRLYTRDGRPVTPVSLREAGIYRFVGKTSSMFDPKLITTNYWMADGRFLGGLSSCNMDLVLFKILDYD